MACLPPASSTTATPGWDPRPDNIASDAELLRGLGSGDADAGHAFVQRYQRRVYGLARKMMEDAMEAEDVAQEALVRAWQNAERYDPRLGSVSSWLLTITRNLAVDALRKERAQPIDPRTSSFLDLPAQGAEPDHVATVADDTDRVRVALRSLPDEQKRALLLAAFYGLTAREISDIESIPLGTAKSRIRMSLIKVRALLRDDEETDDGDDDRALSLIRSSSPVV